MENNNLVDWERINTVASEAIEALGERMHDIINGFCIGFKSLRKAINDIHNHLTVVINSYPNKRIVYLALHHPKERVRKKNIKRILKWIEKGGLQ